MVAYLIWAAVGAAGSGAPIWEQKYEKQHGKCVLSESDIKKGLGGVIIGPLVVSVFAGVGVGALLLFAFRTIPRGMVMFVVFAGTIAPSVAALILFGEKSGGIGTTIVGLGLFGTSGICALIFLKFRKSITLTARLLQETTIALKDNLLLVSSLPLFCLL